MQKKKDEEVTANLVQVMHSTMGAININLCQFKVSGNEIEYDRESKKQIQTRPNVRLSNEKYHKHFNKFVAQKPDPSQTIKVNIKLDIMAY